MATDIYKPSTNPVSGETFKAISFDEDTYITQWSLPPKSQIPIEHIHFNQDEYFHVKKGEVKVVMKGREHIAGEGETVVVPKGTAHISYNNKEEELDCILEYKPALDYNVFMQCYCGLTNDGFIDAKGGIDIPRMGYFLVKMNARCMTRPTVIPALIFKIALRFFYIRGVLSGWKKLYKKYTEK